ncbi:unnamed protein product [marine sediment metagenome]|uniref:Uncharacterized protein n=1 Tax=marine sediment metagenome TaxID=412755 RepID=X1N382_9ZZZZ
MKSEKVIVAQYIEDWVPPYGPKGIPVVIASTHPRYQPGKRFDYGFLRVALTQGYAVIILPTGKPMTETEAEIYKTAEPEDISPHI